MDISYAHVCTICELLVCPIFKSYSHTGHIGTWHMGISLEDEHVDCAH